MALIRNTQSATLAREAIVLDLGDLRRQGDQMIADARQRAEETLAAAGAERERLISGAAAEGREQGRKEGFDQGRAEGLERGRVEGLEQSRKSLDGMITAWSEALATFEQARDAMLSDARADVLTLAVAIAERVTRRAIAHDPGAVGAQIEAAAALLIRATRLVIAVNPDDRAEATRAIPALLERLGAKGHAEVAEDPAIERGSCIIRTDRGEIDATVATQLERIIDTILPQGDARRGALGRGRESEAPGGQSRDDSRPGAGEGGAGP